MSRICPTCDQPIAAEDIVATRPRLPRILPLVAVALLGIAVAVWLWSSRSVEPDEQADDSAVDAEELSEISLTPLETREVEAAAGLGGTVSYLSNEGLVLVDLETGAATVFAAQLEPLGMTGRLLLVSNGEKTFRVDTKNPQALTILSAYGVAAPTEISRIVNLTFAPSNGEGRLSAMIMSLDGGIVGEPVAMPVGSRLETIDHFGMVLIPADGGTYRFTRDGLELLSPNRVIAIADDRRVELQCDDQLVCAPYLVGAETDSVLEGFSGRSEFSFSPDGSRLLGYEAGMLRAVVGTDLGSTTVEADGPAAWTADSSRFGWLSNRGRVLNVADPDGVELARLDLRVLGLPPANSPALVLSS